jgi:predicted transposase YbfD/YdcC
MAVFAAAKEPFLRSCLTLANGLPSHDTFSRLFRNLDPDQFRNSFQRCMAQFSEPLQGMVAIDGKVLHRSFDRASGKSALHMVSAWGSEQRLVLAQIATDAKSNEITAAPKLLKLLTLKGTIVTADALNCQRAIAGQIVEQKGDYALALKGNQGTLFDDVVLLLDDAKLKTSIAAPVVEADHGRIETRTATLSTEIDWLQKQHQRPSAKWFGCAKRRRKPQPKLPTTCSVESCRRSGSTRLSASTGAQKIGCTGGWMCHKRRPGSDANGARAAQSCRSTPYGHQRHAKRGIKRLLARQVQTRRLGRRLPLPATGAILKCDCPGRSPPIKSRIAAARVARMDCRIRRPLSLSTAAEIVSRWTSSPTYRTLFIWVFLSVGLG